VFIFCCIAASNRCEACSMSDAADLPGLQTVVERIENVDIRYSVTFLADELQRNRSELTELRVGQGVILARLDQICQAQFHVDGNARVHWPPPPAEIVAGGSALSSPLVAAMSPFCSESSHSLSQSRSSSAGSQGNKRRRVPEDGDGVWLKCPFCVKEHWNEKSHVQHVERAMERYVAYCHIRMC
jgi:hypothetical protein